MYRLSAPGRPSTVELQRTIGGSFVEGLELSGCLGILRAIELLPVEGCRQSAKSSFLLCLMPRAGCLFVMNNSPDPRRCGAHTPTNRKCPLPTARARLAATE